MKKIRSSKFYTLLKDEGTNLYTIVRNKDNKQTEAMTQTDVEACILDENFDVECKFFNYA